MSLFPDEEPAALPETQTAIGALAEDQAVQYLYSLGYQILERNYRHAHFEADIIALDISIRPAELVIIEVKYRSGPHQLPEQAVVWKKQSHLFTIADHYIRQNRMEDFPCRFDVIAIRQVRGKSDELKHYKDAFRQDRSIR